MNVILKIIGKKIISVVLSRLKAKAQKTPSLVDDKVIEHLEIILPVVIGNIDDIDTMIKEISELIKKM